MRAQISCCLHTAVATAKELVSYLQSISDTVKFTVVPLVMLLGQTMKIDFFLPLSVHFNFHFCTKYSFSSPLLISLLLYITNIFIPIIIK